MKFKVSILYLLLFWFSLNAQNSDTHILIDTQLKSALDSLQQTYKVDIIYLEKDLSTDKKDFTFSPKATIIEALTSLLRSTDLTYISYGNAYFILKENNTDLSSIQKIRYQIEQNTSVVTTEKIHKKIGDISRLPKNGVAQIKGKVTDITNNEPLIGVVIAFDKQHVTLTDEDGNYNINIPIGSYTLTTTYLSFQDFISKVEVYSDAIFNLQLSKNNIDLDEVTITAIKADDAVKETQVGLARINLKEIDKLPTFLGEKDIFKAVLLSPGVTNLGEGASGYNVRGGNVDHNLVMQDEVILFNSTHALGFFSTFNAEMVKDATLIKGNLTADQGGRLASVLKVNLSDGNKEKFRLKFSINPVATTLTTDGPIGSKSTFMAGVRASYTDYLLNFFEDVNLKYSKASFYDINLRYAYTYRKNTFAANAYYSDDYLQYSKQFGFGFSTKFTQFSWQRTLSDSKVNKFYAIASNYNSEQSEIKGNSPSIFQTGITYYKLLDRLSFLWEKSKLDVGISSIYYKVNPGKIAPLTATSFQPIQELEYEFGLESALFASYQTKIWQSLEMIMGVRANHFGALGDKTSFDYASKPYIFKNNTGVSVLKGMYQQYFNLEPRLSLKYEYIRTGSLKAGYARTSQFINQLFNTDTPTPNSQWQLAGRYIHPNLSDNFSVGVFQNFDSNKWEFSVEAFYRNILKLYDYKDFAKLTLNPHIETELLEGKGKTQGIECSIRKNEGKLFGWVSYTYSRASQLVKGVNQNQWYPSGYDKPHSVSVLLNYKPKLRHTLTLNFTYSTGRPTTAPYSNYVTPDNVYVPIFSERNQLRIPDYHRLDVSYNIARSHNELSKFRSSWTFILYNVYARKNPFTVFYTRGINDIPQANKLSVVGTIFPAIRFNLEFQ